MVYVSATLDSLEMTVVLDALRTALEMETALIMNADVILAL